RKNRREGEADKERLPVSLWNPKTGLVSWNQSYVFPCRSLECSTVCYFQEFVEECPEAKEALLKLNVGQIHSIAITIHPVSFERMTQECRNVHDTDHMKKKMLGIED
ncbi:hypothetical protein NECAME_18932, partial [Necator americanus]